MVVGGNGRARGAARPRRRGGPAVLLGNEPHALRPARRQDGRSLETAEDATPARRLAMGRGFGRRRGRAEPDQRLAGRTRPTGRHQAGVQQRIPAAERAVAAFVARNAIAMLDSLGDVARHLNSRNPDRIMQVYRDLGLQVVYDNWGVPRILDRASCLRGCVYARAASEIQRSVQGRGCADGDRDR